MSNENEKKRVQDALNSAMELATKHRNEYCTTEHILYYLLEQPETVEMLQAGAYSDPKLIILAARKKLSEFMATKLSKASSYGDWAAPQYNAPQQSESVLRCLRAAAATETFTSAAKVPFIGVCSLLMEIAKEREAFSAQVLDKLGLTTKVISEYAANKARTASADAAADGKKAEADEFSNFCKNLSELAAEGKIDPVVGRKDELKRTIEVLGRRRKNNAIYTGKEGVGKTAIAEGLALMIHCGEVPEPMKGKVVWSLEVGSMVAGTKYRGELEERLRKVLDKLRSDGNAILFIDEIHQIMGAGKSEGSSMDVANILKPMLARGEISVIGATTDDEFSTYFEKDRALMRRFQRIDIAPPSKSDTALILKGTIGAYESFHNVTFEEGSVDLIVDLCDRYIKTRHFPDKAIDVMDSVGSRVKLAGLSVVTHKDITALVSEMANMPVDAVDVKENTQLASLAQRIKENVYGQDNAVDRVVDAVIIAKASRRNPAKPVGSYLFVGPTGTGKTELCKTLADQMGIKLIRFDMSEYQEEHSVSRLIGAPPGYVGHGQGEAGAGQLISAVEKNPNCIVLLDEIEKAHPKVMTTLLQVMDDGRLTSSTGKLVHFNNALIVFTSNAGAAEADRTSIGFNASQYDESSIDRAVKRTFTPEFRNRLDGIIRFNPLAKEQMLSIVDKIIDRANKQSESAKVFVTLTKEAKVWFAEHGFDPKMGARPLERLVQTTLDLPIARETLFGKLQNGGRVTVRVKGGEIAFEFKSSEEIENSLKELAATV